MATDIKKIIDSLDEAQGKLEKSRDKLGDWASELGFQIELADDQKGLWTELDKQGGVPVPIIISGYNMAQSLVQNAEQIAHYVDSSSLEQAIQTASSASEVGIGTVMSGATISYPPNQLPPSYYQLNKNVMQRLNEQDISQKLRAIDASLADEYDNAWQGLHSTTKDKTRAPMFLMREVLTRLYHHYAPDDKVEAYFHLVKPAKIERKQRIAYIASLMDPWKKQTFLKEEQAFLDSYQELSKAHKHGSLDPSETRGSLYQANGLIKLLLELL